MSYEALSSKPILNSIGHVLPRPTPTDEASYRTLLSNLHFINRFDYLGQQYPLPDGRMFEDFSRALFCAHLDRDGDRSEVLVKFCFRYSGEAHRLLAEHEPPLAPPLRECVPFLGGITMVIMDIIPPFE